jgi:hypothetical protein
MKNSLNHLQPPTTFKKPIFVQFWLCPAISRICFSHKNNWNQLNNWKKHIPVY